jgi:hypothetical protein
MEELQLLPSEAKHTDYTMEELSDMLTKVGNEIIRRSIKTMPDDDPKYGKEWRRITEMMNEKAKEAHESETNKED